MSLVFAAIAPHPPLLIPAIGKDVLKKAEKTKTALEQLEEDLYLSHPDVIIIITPHGSFFQDAFTLNMNPAYETDLHEFGDLTTKLKFKSDMQLVSRLRERSRDADFPVGAISQTLIDHGQAVPLFYLTAHLPNISIVPVGFCDLPWKSHLDFGNLIKECVMETKQRVAVIASGDLSHALTTDAPAGYNAAGKEFDQKIQELLATNNVAGMLQLDKKFVSDAAECGFRSFLILMGILQGVNHTYKSHSYEGPFGVGYLTANFVLEN